MEYKRLKSGKNIPSEKAALLSFCAKEQIYGYVHNQFFETLKLPEECSEVSGEINKAGWMILRSTQEMNEYFEAVSGTENYKNQKTEICNIVSILCEKARPFIENKGISFSCKVPLENIFVNIDRERFFYAALNLLLNAAENISKNGKIKVSVSKTSKFVKITVSDNGIGMNEETIIRCTEPFFVKGEIPGKKRMGLGLTLAHHFAVKSGGRFKIKSTIGEGTSVSILLPVAETDKTELFVGSFSGEIPGGTFSPVEIVLSSLK